MKNYLKEQLSSNFLKILMEDMPQLTEAQHRRIAEKLTDSSFSSYITNSSGLTSQLKEAILDVEKHRAQFKNYIDFTQKQTNTILKKFKEKSFITKKYDENTHKTILKGQTTMVDEMVYFLNGLNDLVILFYKEVYKVDQTSIETPQITLF
jgi:hypothetical protein